MKTVKLTLLYLSLFILFSCGNTEDNMNASFSNSLSATINGTIFTAEEVVVVKSADPNTGASVVVITGTAGANSEDVINFNLFNISNAGTYPLGSNSNWASYTENVLNTTDIFVTTTNSGNITITEFNDNGIKGTFEFEAQGSSKNVIQVTNGQFESTF